MNIFNKIKHWYASTSLLKRELILLFFCCFILGIIYSIFLGYNNSIERKRENIQSEVALTRKIFQDKKKENEIKQSIFLFFYQQVYKNFDWELRKIESFAEDLKSDKMREKLYERITESCRQNSKISNSFYYKPINEIKDSTIYDYYFGGGFMKFDLALIRGVNAYSGLYDDEFEILNKRSNSLLDSMPERIDDTLGNVFLFIVIVLLSIIYPIRGVFYLWKFKIISPKKIVIGISALIVVLFITNPSIGEFKGFIGDTKCKISVSKDVNYIIYSVFTAKCDCSTAEVQYFGIIKNFFWKRGTVYGKMQCEKNRHSRHEYGK